MRTRALDHLEIDAGVVMTAIISGAIAFLGWVIRVAARETLAGFKNSLAQHSQALKDMADEVRELRIELAEVKARVSVVENRE